MKRILLFLALVPALYADHACSAMITRLEYGIGPLGGI